MPRLASLAISIAWLSLAFAAVGCRCGADDEASGPTTAGPSSEVLLDEEARLSPEGGGDERGPFGRHRVRVTAAERIGVDLRSSAFDPVLEVTPPGGQRLVNDDWQGDRTRSRIELLVASDGELLIDVRSYDPAAGGAYALRVERLGGAPSGGEARSLRSGESGRGRLEPGDTQLSDGSLVDTWTLELDGPARISVSPANALRTILVGPDGRTSSARSPGVHFADGAGRHRLQILGGAAGPLDYEVRVGSGEQGSVLERAHHEFSRILEELGNRRPQNGPREAEPPRPHGESGARHDAGPHPLVLGRPYRGTLGPSHPRLPSGEHYETFTLELEPSAAGTLTIELSSSAFDTYLRARGPDGQSFENDDWGGTTNSVLELDASAGTWTLVVTSYRAGETGPYLLQADLGPSPRVVPDDLPAPSPRPTLASAGAGAGEDGGEAREITGRLGPGSATLQSGEFMEPHTLSFTAGNAVSIRMESSELDPYLILRTPSGRQDDNDDFEPGSLTAGFDIGAAEAGDYRLLATTYQPGEAGAYTLRITERPSVIAVPRPAGDDGQPAGEGGRVWGLFVGITDYAGRSSNLPECANDAIKLAETLRGQGNMPASQEFLFTDAEATVANVRGAMQRVAAGIGPDDVFIFFFSGHGGQTATSQDPRELDGRDEYLVLRDGDILDDELGRLFDPIGARLSMVAIDACFAGGFAKDIITRPGRVGLFSSEEDVTSAVADRFQAGGYLSHFLRVGMAGAADTDPADNILTVGEITHYVWVQFAQHASDVRMSTGYQMLVVDRGAVPTGTLLWALR